MAVETYSTYEAKSHFSEILRKVRAGRPVIVTHHGRRVAEIRPVESVPDRLDDRLVQLEREGVLEPAGDAGLHTQPLARRRGALARFIASRE